MGERAAAILRRGRLSAKYIAAQYAILGLSLGLGQEGMQSSEDVASFGG